MRMERLELIGTCTTCSWLQHGWHGTFDVSLVAGTAALSI